VSDRIRRSFGAILSAALLPGSTVLAQEPKSAGTAVELAGAAQRAVGLGFAAALTMAVCVLGASYAVGRIGSAAMGAAAEKPELLIRSLIFVALAEGLAVLGFAISMMILQKF
jgi:V/A-type H+-transporting ATPase subunit K